MHPRFSQLQLNNHPLLLVLWVPTGHADPWAITPEPPVVQLLLLWKIGMDNLLNWKIEQKVVWFPHCLESSV